MSIIQNIAYLRQSETSKLPVELRNAAESVLTVADFGTESDYSELFDKKEQSEIEQLVQEMKMYESPNKPKPKSTAKAKTAAKASATVKKAKASRKASAKPRIKSKPEESKATAKPKNTNSKPQTEKPVSKTHIETPEHRQVKRFLSIRKKETLQLAMTAYKSLLKDITERKIRKTSEQASLINAIQQSYFKYISRSTSSLILSETNLKAANEFVGSQKPYETVVLVKRFIGWTGKSATEKQIRDYLKEADKVVKDSRDNDPYLYELKSIIKTLKSAKVGDTLIADNVGLSGLNSNTIRVRK